MCSQAVCFWHAESLLPCMVLACYPAAHLGDVQCHDTRRWLKDDGTAMFRGTVLPRACKGRRANLSRVTPESVSSSMRAEHTGDLVQC